MNKKYIIKQEQDKCIGCNACVLAAPKYWEMNSSCIATLINSKNNHINLISDDFDINHDAAKCCPVNCIHIFKIKDDNSEEKII